MNLLGIDFEDWYHPELVQKHLPKKRHTPTVINGIDKILDYLRKNDTFATFFIVGELIESKPELIDKILGDGHEIGFHTMNHTRLDVVNFRSKFGEELELFSRLTDKKSRGFRAPTFSLNHHTAWAIDALVQNNYEYDSSIVPVKTTMYGIPNARTKPYRISSSSLEHDDPNSKLIEFPLSVGKLLGKRIPVAGGFYLRVLPQKIIHNAITEYEKNNIPATCYIHSWELTPEYMKKISLPVMDRFITYYNLTKASDRLEKIIKKFRFTSFSKYLAEHKN